MSALSPCGEMVRTGDPERFRTALFAPPEAREGLFALYAFSLEIAKIAPMVSEPMIGEIRLQWWRDSLDMIFGGGQVRRHEVVEPLCAVVRGADLPRAPFETLIDARGNDLEPDFPAELSALTAYLRDTAGSLTLLAARALGSAADDIALDAGQGVGTARYLAAISAMGGKPVPGDIDWSTVRAGEGEPVFAAAIHALAAEGRAAIARARAGRGDVGKAAASAFLEVPAADRTLAAIMAGPGTLASLSAQPSPFRANFSNLWRGATGRW